MIGPKPSHCKGEAITLAPRKWSEKAIMPVAGKNPNPFHHSWVSGTTCAFHQRIDATSRGSPRSFGSRDDRSRMSGKVRTMARAAYAAKADTKVRAGLVTSTTCVYPVGAASADGLMRLMWGVVLIGRRACGAPALLSESRAHPGHARQ